MSCGMRTASESSHPRNLRVRLETETRRRRKLSREQRLSASRRLPLFRSLCHSRASLVPARSVADCSLAFPSPRRPALPGPPRACCELFDFQVASQPFPRLATASPLPQPPDPGMTSPERKFEVGNDYKMSVAPAQSPAASPRLAPRRLPQTRRCRLRAQQPASD